MILLYVLSLSNGKYYIGKSQQFEVRLGQHIGGGGSSWTKKYKPKKVVETIEGDDGDEDKMTLRYMKKYGIDNVRGGSFCRITLSVSDRETLEKMLNTIRDMCYHCNKEGHFSSKCPNKDSFISNKTFRGKSNKKIITCKRCGRKGHYYPGFLNNLHTNLKSNIELYNYIIDEVKVEFRALCEFKKNNLREFAIYTHKYLEPSKAQKQSLGGIFTPFELKRSSPWGLNPLAPSTGLDEMYGNFGLNLSESTVECCDPYTLCYCNPSIRESYIHDFVRDGLAVYLPEEEEFYFDKILSNYEQR